MPKFSSLPPPPQKKTDIARHVPVNKGTGVRVMMLNITVVFSRSVVLTCMDIIIIIIISQLVKVCFYRDCGWRNIIIIIIQKQWPIANSSFILSSLSIDYRCCSNREGGICVIFRKFAMLCGHLKTHEVARCCWVSLFVSNAQCPLSYNVYKLPVAI